MGGINGVIVVDATAEFCTQNGGTADEIEFFKTYTLPMIGHYDDMRRLDLVSNWERKRCANLSKLVLDFLNIS